MPQSPAPTDDGDHPGDRRLTEWLAGGLTPEQQTAVETHLTGCDRCAERLESLESPDDPLIAKLRAADRRLSTSRTLSAPLGQTDNLRFGAAALELGVLSPERFAQACRLWLSRGGKETLAGVLVAQGWLDRSERELVESTLAEADAGEAEAARPSADKTLAGGVEPAGKTLVVEPISTERLSLKHLHSTGGSGRVWRAFDRVLKRDVALKELLPEFTGSAKHRDRFYREACVTAQLEHPGTVPIHEFRNEAGRPYYTMKFLTGRTLSEVIAETHAQSEGGGDEDLAPLFRLLSMFLRVCDTIAYSHSRGVIHRDLKGDNILVGEFGEVTVIDWGLAKAIEIPDGDGLPDGSDNPSVTMAGERLGTPAYMSPEQAMGDVASVDARTDVYGLSAMLYEILAGRPPFGGETVEEVLRMVATQPPPPPLDFHPTLPVELQEICLKGLSKSRDDRQQTVIELRDSIREWVAHQAERQRDAESRAEFFSLSSDLFVTLDEKGRLTHVNPAYERLFGRDSAESVGATYHKTVHPDDLEPANRAFGVAARGDSAQDIIIRVVTEDGSYVPISWTVTKAPGEPTIYAIGRPLDEESERRRNAESRAHFFALSSDLFVVSDEQGLAGQINAAWERVLGWTPEEVVGRPYSEFMDPRDLGLAARAARRALLKESVVDLEIRMRCKDGSLRLIAWTLTRVPGERINYAIGRDVTELKHIERRQQAILDASPDAVLAVDKNGTITFINARLTEAFGYESHELVGEPLETLMPERFRETHRGHFRSYFDAPTVRSMGAGNAFVGRHKDGTERTLDVSLSPLRINDELLVVAAIRLHDESSRWRDNTPGD